MTLSPRARRILTLVLTAVVPVLLFANVLQGMRYTRLEREVRELEQVQQEWFEKNKALLAAIGIYSSPRRIESVQDPSARSTGGEGTLRVRIEDGSGEATDAR